MMQLAVRRRRFGRLSQIEKYLRTVTNYEKETPAYVTRNYNLANMHTMMRALGDPHAKFKSIHVGGSSGKGSVCHILDSIYTSSGYKTGRYISPHLVSMLERICINNEPVSEELFIESFNEIHGVFEDCRPTFFEIFTALAFQIFAKEGVDIAIVETGLGGRLDCTNIIRPELCVLATIEIEHRNVLGRTLSSIAREEAGIIKDNCDVVAVDSGSVVNGVLERVCAKRSARLSLVKLPEVVFDKRRLSCRFDTVFLGKAITMRYPGFSIARGLSASVALKVVELLNSKYPVRNVLDTISKLDVEGRAQILRKRPYIIVDNGHTARSIDYLLKSVKQLEPDRIFVICAFLKDKEIDLIMKTILSYGADIILVDVNSPRQADYSKIADRYRNTAYVGRWQDALKLSLNKSTHCSAIVITGSTYLVGEVLPHYRRV